MRQQRLHTCLRTRVEKPAIHAPAKETADGGFRHAKTQGWPSKPLKRYIIVVIILMIVALALPWPIPDKLRLISTIMPLLLLMAPVGSAAQRLIAAAAVGAHGGTAVSDDA